MSRFTSREWQLDREMDGLIGKILDGSASVTDRAALAYCTTERARLMQPNLMRRTQP